MTDCSADVYKARPERVLAAVEPKAGLCLIFFHPILHEGGQLEPTSADK
jgi:hypothetical protein